MHHDEGHISSWVSIHSSKSSKETLQDRYTDVKYVIQDQPTTIILPLDSSPLSVQCLQFYIRSIHKIGNKVCILYVSEEFVKMGNDNSNNGKNGCSCCNKCTKKAKVVRGVGPSPGILKELERADKARCHEFKRIVKKWFRTNGVLFEFHRLVSNDPPKAIVEFTKEKNGDMVMMAARRLSGLKAPFMHSVSEKVAGISKVPVLLIKED